MIFENYPAFLLALAIWRESRDQPLTAKIGVGCVIRNRMAASPAQGWPADYAGNILKPWQFSSFNANDPNAAKFPQPSQAADWAAFQDCCTAAEAVMGGCPDATKGATFYFSAPITEPPPAWGKVQQTESLGGLSFWKLV